MPVAILAVAVCAFVLETPSIRSFVEDVQDPIRFERDGAPYTGIEIQAGRGRIELGAGSSSAIEVRIDPPRTGAASLEHSVSGGILRLRLPDDDRDYVWTVLVPARYSARLALDRGSMTVRGVEGGVRASLGAAHGARNGIDVEVPHGPLDLRLDVGRIRATTGAATHGPVDVRSGVGDARVAIDGHQIEAPRRPGPGHRLRLSGSSGDALTLRVKVGDASLTIR